MRVYDITPAPKPRQTRSDKWKQRPCVLRYRAFADECRSKGVTVENSDRIIFVMPMPKSWNKKKKEAMDGEPHMQKPDFDNLAKSICDAVHQDDSHLWNIGIMKVWGYHGQIIIEPME